MVKFPGEFSGRALRASRHRIKRFDNESSAEEKADALKKERPGTVTKIFPIEDL